MVRRSPRPRALPTGPSRRVEFEPCSRMTSDRHAQADHLFEYRPVCTDRHRTGRRPMGGAEGITPPRSPLRFVAQAPQTCYLIAPAVGAPVRDLCFQEVSSHGSVLVEPIAHVENPV